MLENLHSVRRKWVDKGSVSVEAAFIDSLLAGPFLSTQCYATQDQYQTRWRAKSVSEEQCDQETLQIVTSLPRPMTRCKGRHAPNLGFTADPDLKSLAPQRSSIGQTRTRTPRLYVIMYQASLFHCDSLLLTLPQHRT